MPDQKHSGRTEPSIPMIELTKLFRTLPEPTADDPDIIPEWLRVTLKSSGVITPAFTMHGLHLVHWGVDDYEQQMRDKHQRVICCAHHQEGFRPTLIPFWMYAALFVRAPQSYQERFHILLKYKFDWPSQVWHALPELEVMLERYKRYA